MQGIKSFADSNAGRTYRTWAAIAFRFNQNHLNHMQKSAQALGMDMFQLTKSTKFGSHYPEAYGKEDPLCPDRPDLVSSNHRFQRVLAPLTGRARPSDSLKEIFWQRAQNLDKHNQYIGNKGMFLNSQGEFYPCCWTANRYPHNQQWHDLSQSRFNLWHRSFEQILKDDFWSGDFLDFDSLECRTKWTKKN